MAVTGYHAGPLRAYPHWVAVAIIASVAIVHGGGYAGIQVALRAGLSLGAVPSLRFGLAALGMGVLLLLRRNIRKSTKSAPAACELLR
jgi:hypothetical protein